VNKTEKEAVLDVFAGLLRSLMPVAFEYGISAGKRPEQCGEAISRLWKRDYESSTGQRLTRGLEFISGLPKADVSALREAMRVGAALSIRTAASFRSDN